MCYDITRWLYENNSDNSARFILGKQGTKSLICIGINPSTAVPDGLDLTLKIVENKSIVNGYNSWIMLNVYPQRSTKPKGLDQQVNQVLHAANLEAIKSVLKNDSIIWAAWGGNIKIRDYLTDCLKNIYNLTLKLNCRWVCLDGEFDHPHHPIGIDKDTKLVNFDIESYIQKL